MNRRNKLQSSKASELQRSILKTISYADIFDYPLTDQEVQKFLIGNTEAGTEVVRKTLLQMIADCQSIDADGDFYFLKSRKEIVKLRKKREKWSKEKIAIARKVSQRLGKLPWVKMIGVTGALAMNNCKEDDDIDLLIITPANRLWLTRLIILLICPFWKIKRRKPEDKNIKDKICFNLFLDEDHLKISPESLFLAHEICQVKPLINKNKTYERFLWENKWVGKFLPNSNKITNYELRIKNYDKNIISQYLNLIISFLEFLVFSLQSLYMRPKKTIEKVSLHQAFFHPQDLSEKINMEYRQKLNSLGRYVYLNIRH